MSFTTVQCTPSKITAFKEAVASQCTYDPVSYTYDTTCCNKQRDIYDPTPHACSYDELQVIGQNSAGHNMSCRGLENGL